MRQESLFREKAAMSSETRAHILIVDDEDGIRGILEELLSARHECRAVSSAEEALSLLATEKFDLVLSDIRMSGMSGLEMIPYALKSAPDTVVMMISGEPTIESAIEAMRVGAFDYIRKPFDLQHVEAAVNRALDHHSLLEAKRLYENHLEELVSKRTAERDNLTYHDALIDLPSQIEACLKIASQKPCPLRSATIAPWACCFCHSISLRKLTTRSATSWRENCYRKSRAGSAKKFPKEKQSLGLRAANLRCWLLR